MTNEDKARLKKLWDERPPGQGANEFDREHCAKFKIRSGSMQSARAACGLKARRGGGR